VEAVEAVEAVEIVLWFVVIMKANENPGFLVPGSRWSGQVGVRPGRFWGGHGQSESGSRGAPPLSRPIRGVPLSPSGASGWGPCGDPQPVAGMGARVHVRSRSVGLPWDCRGIAVGLPWGARTFV
jgi:hypothetical protein